MTRPQMPADWCPDCGLPEDVCECYCPDCGHDSLFCECVEFGDDGQPGDGSCLCHDSANCPDDGFTDAFDEYERGW